MEKVNLSCAETSSSMPNVNTDWKERSSKVKIYTDSAEWLMGLADYQGLGKKKPGGCVIRRFGEKVYGSLLSPHGPRM